MLSGLGRNGLRGRRIEQTCVCRPRDTVGWVADVALTPMPQTSTRYGSARESIGLCAHKTVNYMCFNLGDYVAIKGAAIDPYSAMRDAHVQ
jgi:phospholipid-binding lipoprotein MlaA